MQHVVSKAVGRNAKVLRCFQWNRSLHLWITDEDENGDFRANDNDWLIRMLPRAFPQCLWQGKNHVQPVQDPGLWAKGRNRRHIVDYQPLKVQHLAQHLCNRGATFCPFFAQGVLMSFLAFPPSQSLRMAGPGNGGCDGAARWRVRGKTKDNAQRQLPLPRKQRGTPQNFSI